MFGLDPVTIGVGALIWAAFKKQTGSASNHGVLTSERELIFNNAMEHAEASRLVELAKLFEKDGLRAQAFWMRKRAAWRSRTPEVKAQHDAIFSQAMKSEKIEGILEVAKLFEEQTATIKAAALRERVKSLNETRQKREAEVAEKAKAEVEAKAVVDKLKTEQNPQGANVNGRQAANADPQGANAKVMTSHNSEIANGGLRDNPKAS